MNDPLDIARAHFREGVVLFEAGKPAEAAQRFEAALVLAPGRVSVLINLGAARLRLGQAAEAIDVLDAALAGEPQHADAWCHRGLAMSELDRHAEAVESFDKALALDAGNPMAAYCRAMALSRLRRPAQALDAVAALLEREPRHGAAWLLHGQLLQMLCRHGEALPSYERAVAAEPSLGDAWSLLGQLRMDLGRSGEAVAVFERAIEAGADPQTNRYFLAALGHGPAPSTAPPDYVRALFDGYADDFEPHLVNVLRYRAHEEVARSALQVLQARPPAGGAGGHIVDRALDLGCGTGLCGPLLKPGARHLEGVDLSATMLEAARQRGAYDLLVQAELVAHLHATSRRYGLVVCADTFIYVGDLSAAFAGVRRVLEPGGVFVFSVERADDAHDFVLTSHLRYAHAEGYVRRLAAEHGLALVDVRGATLREEQRQAVQGLICCAVAPAPA
jgi:predicted TPR repeat methyltransferase